MEDYVNYSLSNTMESHKKETLLSWLLTIQFLKLAKFHLPTCTPKYIKLLGQQTQVCEIGPSLENKALTVKAFLRLFFFEALRFSKKKVVKASKTLRENHHFWQILGEKLLFLGYILSVWFKSGCFEGNFLQKINCDLIFD